MESFFPMSFCQMQLQLQAMLRLLRRPHAVRPPVHVADCCIFCYCTYLVRLVCLCGLFCGFFFFFFHELKLHGHTLKLKAEFVSNFGRVISTIGNIRAFFPSRPGSDASRIEQVVPAGDSVAKSSELQKGHGECWGCINSESTVCVMSVCEWNWNP